MIEAGTQVTVAQPVKNFDGSLLLPGEEIFVIERRTGAPGPRLPTGDRSRVRCPASGVDMWVDTEILTVPAERGLLAWVRS